MGQSLLQEGGAGLMPCWAGMLLDYKKGDRASANSCPQVASSEACPHCISHLLTLPGGRLRLGGETQGFTLGKGVKSWWECRLIPCRSP